MISARFLALGALLSALAAISSTEARLESRAAATHDHRSMAERVRRATVAGKAIASSWDQVADHEFDYVIVGGGTAGLTLAGRLSEDEDVSVAVIEAGASGYGHDDDLLVPDAAYYKSSVGTDFDWKYKTSGEKGLYNRQVDWPRGKVLGGSSAINGLYFVAASGREHQALGRMSNDTERWGWHSVRSAMRKATVYGGKPIAALQSLIDVDDATLGYKGPVSVGYPGHTYKPVEAWLPALEAVGIEQAGAPYNGSNQGAFIAASTIKTDGFQRSFSRTAYLDPISDKRDNLIVIPGQHATRLVWGEERDDKGQLRALGVEFAASSDAPRVWARARREVIVSAGAIGSPQLLQLSGLGRKELLNKHDIDVMYDLPGVGRHLQDHLSASVSHSAANGVVLQSADAKSAEERSYVDSSVAYLTLKDLLGSQAKADAFLEKASELTDGYIAKSDAPASVKRGMRKTFDMLINNLLADKAADGFQTFRPKAAMELLLATTSDKITVQTALQSPFSRGYVHIVSDDPFRHPQIDAGYLSHAADSDMMVAALKFARKVSYAAPLNGLIEAEEAPGTNVTTDAELLKYVRKTAGTEYHPSSTCAMMSEYDGGVVGSDLRVHGTSNVRVVDASVLPFALSSHLMSAVYSIAEIAADIIKEDRRAGRSDAVEACDAEVDDGEDEDDSQKATKASWAEEESENDDDDEECEDDDE